MINLLPVEEKKKIARDYRFRVLIFYFYAFGAFLAVATVSLLPSYFLSSLKERLTAQKLEILKSLPVSEPDQATLDAIKDVNAKIAIINGAEKSKFLVLENAVDEVILRKMPDIKITSIDYEKKDGVKGINLHGLAPNRERLLLFRQALEEDKAFSSVDLPISNFVKGANIDFSLNLVSK